MSHIASLAQAVQVVQAEAIGLEAQIQEANTLSHELQAAIDHSVSQAKLINERKAQLAEELLNAELELDDLRALQTCRQEQVAALKEQCTAAKVRVQLGLHPQQSAARHICARCSTRFAAVCLPLAHAHTPSMLNQDNTIVGSI